MSSLKSLTTRFLIAALLPSMALGWVSPARAASPDFSLAVLPDTQYYTSEYPEILTGQIEWLIDQRANLNLAYVAGLGDITNLGDSAPQEWQNAWEAISLLENPSLTGLEQGIPYGLAVGNHDQTPLDDPNGATSLYNRYFGVSHFADYAYYGGNFGNNNDSHYDLFSAGSLDFIVIYLENGASSEAIHWANTLLQTYSGRYGILVSHALLAREATFTAEGQSIYEALKANSNLLLMLCGHNWAVSHRADTYNGHTIYTLMADYSNLANGGDGWLQILTFSPLANQLSIRTYSPTLNQFKTDASNQFSLPLDLGETDFTATISAADYTQAMIGQTSLSLSVYWGGLRVSIASLGVYVTRTWAGIKTLASSFLAGLVQSSASNRGFLTETQFPSPPAFPRLQTLRLLLPVWVTLLTLIVFLRRPLFRVQPRNR